MYYIDQAKLVLVLNYQNTYNLYGVTVVIIIYYSDVIHNDKMQYTMPIFYLIIIISQYGKFTVVKYSNNFDVLFGFEIIFFSNL